LEEIRVYNMENLYHNVRNFAEFIFVNLTPMIGQSAELYSAISFFQSYIITVKHHFSWPFAKIISQNVVTIFLTKISLKI